MEINIELYKTFYYIVKEGSITRAADRLFISQSAVTQSLKKLEEQLGGKLFIRNKSGVRLTSEGEKLYNYIEGSINTLNNAENLFSQYLNNEIGTIRIACGSAIGMVIMPKIIQKFSMKYPNIKIEMTNYKTKDSQMKLLKDEIDISFLESTGSKVENGLEVISLTDFKFCFFTTPKYLKKIGEFKKENINDYTFILPLNNTRRFDILNERLKAVGIEITPRYEFSSANMIESVVEQGIGIGYINELFIKDKIKNGTFVKINLGIEEIKDELAIIIKDKNAISNAALKFIDTIKEAF